MPAKAKKQTKQVAATSILRAIGSCAGWRRCGISIAQARQPCYHYMGAICRKSHDKSITEAANLRQAEAKVEMLKGR